MHCSYLHVKACQASAKSKQDSRQEPSLKCIGSGMPDVFEVCILTEFLLEYVSLETSIDTPSEHLPGLFYDIIRTLMQNVNSISLAEIAKSLELCSKILSKVQPTVAPVVAQSEKLDTEVKANTTSNVAAVDENSLNAIPLEKSQSDSKLNKSAATILTATDSSPSPRRR